MNNFRGRMPPHSFQEVGTTCWESLSLWKQWYEEQLDAKFAGTRVTPVSQQGSQQGSQRSQVNIPNIPNMAEQRRQDNTARYQDNKKAFDDSQFIEWTA